MSRRVRNIEAKLIGCGSIYLESQASIAQDRDSHGNSHTDFVQNSHIENKK
jgi:hypothetical protein